MNTPRPFLLAILLVAIGIRSVLGAPCCVFVAHAYEGNQQQHDTHDHYDHADHFDDDGHTAPFGHESHGDDPSANPCCTACGPTLPPEPTMIGAVALVLNTPLAEPVRELKTRPPFPAYEARGPPLQV